MENSTTTQRRDTNCLSSRTNKLRNFNSYMCMRTKLFFSPAMRTMVGLLKELDAYDLI